MKRLNSIADSLKRPNTKNILQNISLIMMDFYGIFLILITYVFKISIDVFIKVSAKESVNKVYHNYVFN